MNLDKVRDGVYDNVVGISPQSLDDLEVVESSSRFQGVVAQLNLSLRADNKLVDCIAKTALGQNLSLRAECIYDVAKAFSNCGLDELTANHQVAAVREVLKPLALRFNSESQVGMPIERSGNFDQFVDGIIILVTGRETL